MTKINTANNYDYYMGWDEKNVPFYNIVPKGNQAPSGGYYSDAYICKIKNVPNLFI